MTESNFIRISEETRKNLIADIAKVQENGYDVANVTIEKLMSRAQAFPERHLLDIMYQDGLPAAIKTLITYYSVPVINFDQEYPMHAGFFDVFHFCGKMVGGASYDAANVEEVNLDHACLEIRSWANVLLIPEMEKLYQRDFKEKKDFLDLFNIIRKNWSEESFGSNIYSFLYAVMDFPALKFIDSPVARINFAIWLRQLTAFWPETVWNWENFQC